MNDVDDRPRTADQTALERGTARAVFRSLEKAAFHCAELIEAGRLSEINPPLLVALIGELQEEMRLNLDGPTIIESHIGADRAQGSIEAFARAIGRTRRGPRRSARKWDAEQSARLMRYVFEPLGLPSGPEFDELIALKYLRARREAGRPENRGRRSATDIFREDMAEWIESRPGAYLIHLRKEEGLVPGIVQDFTIRARQIVDNAPAQTHLGVRRYLGLTARARRAPMLHRRKLLRRSNVRRIPPK